MERLSQAVCDIDFGELSLFPVVYLLLTDIFAQGTYEQDTHKHAVEFLNQVDLLLRGWRTSSEALQVIH